MDDAGSAHDLARLREELDALRERLHRAERLALVGQRAASMAHEAKNLLSAVIGYSQLMGRALPDVPEAVRPTFAKGLGIVQDESRRLQRMAEDVLSMSPGATPLQSAEGDCDFGRAVQDALSLVAVEKGGALIEVRVEDGVEGVRVRGEHDQLRGAVLNLLLNALESAPADDPPRVCIEAARQGDRVVCDVVDDGPGIPAAVLQEVTEPFFTTKRKGSGLGLSIVREAVELGGGTFEIGPGEGGVGTRARMILSCSP